MVRSDGAQVAVVRPDHSVHLQKVEVGRDYGDHLEVVRGLQEGATVILNPGDAVQEGQKVRRGTVSMNDYRLKPVDS